MNELKNQKAPKFFHQEQSETKEHNLKSKWQSMKEMEYYGSESNTINLIFQKKNLKDSGKVVKMKIATMQMLYS